MEYDIFNGDADGICALHQWRMVHPAETGRVTGVKRDIKLLSKIDAQSGDHVNVFDISFDSNRVDVRRLLDAGASLRWFDHHFAGDIPKHPALQTSINTASDTCTSLLVDHALAGRFRVWAVVAAFGDNLAVAAQRAAEPLALASSQLTALAELGKLLNYNGYGDNLADLHFDPDELYRSLAGCENPFDYIAASTVFGRLREGYTADREAAASLRPYVVQKHATAYLMPNEPWARRVIGVLANELATDFPDRAHAILVPNQMGDLTVSVRSPLNRPQGADTLCLQYPTGGGRKAAAGINQLPVVDVERFISDFTCKFGRPSDTRER